MPRIPFSDETLEDDLRSEKDAHDLTWGEFLREMFAAYQHMHSDQLGVDLDEDVDPADLDWAEYRRRVHGALAAKRMGRGTESETVDSADLEIPEGIEKHWQLDDEELSEIIEEAVEDGTPVKEIVDRTANRLRKEVRDLLTSLRQ